MWPRTGLEKFKSQFGLFKEKRFPCFASACLSIDVGPVVLAENDAHRMTCKRKLIRKTNKIPFLPSRYVKGSVGLALT